MTRRNDRPGFTLMEIMAVMSVGGLMMLLAIAWIGETTKFASRMRSHQRQHDQLTRLGWHLRTDVRLSQSMTIEDDERLVLRGGDGQQIVYSISGTTIEMEKSGGSQVSREKFSLATGSMIAWDTSGMPDSIGLIVSRDRDGQLAVNESPDRAGSVNRKATNTVESETVPSMFTFLPTSTVGLSNTPPTTLIEVHSDSFPVKDRMTQIRSEARCCSARLEVAGEWVEVVEQEMARSCSSFWFVWPSRQRFCLVQSKSASDTVGKSAPKFSWNRPIGCWTLESARQLQNTTKTPDFADYSFATNGSLENYTGSVDIKVIERNDNNASLLVTAKLQGQHEHSPLRNDRV